MRGELEDQGLSTAPVEVLIAGLPDDHDTDRRLLSLAAGQLGAHNIKQVSSQAQPREIMELARGMRMVIACPKRSRNLYMRSLVWSVIRAAQKDGRLLEVVYPTPR
jgi:hypothetical protein